MPRLDAWLAEHIVCPRDRTHLRQRDDALVCDQQHTYPCVADIPVLLTHDLPPTLPNPWLELADLAHTRPDTSLNQPAVVDQFVQEMVAATSGHLYTPLVGKLPRYPIPASRLPPGRGARLLDIGCNWGRWTISAARAGYTPVGLDPQLSAALAARRVAHQFGTACAFVVGDARALPFSDAAFTWVFSYSVIQHFSKPDARSTLRQVHRVLAPGGECLIQMPNRWGLRSLQRQWRRRGQPVGVFDVRYWTRAELAETFESLIGPTTISVDGFFGLGIQPADIDLLPMHFKLVVVCSEVLRHLSTRPGLRWLVNVADSLSVHARRSAAIAWAR